MKWLRELFAPRNTDRRKSRRLTGPVDLRLITSSRHALPAELDDISESGLRFRMRKPLSDRHVPVAVYVRCGSRQETLPIEILRSEDSARAAGPMIAARFLIPNPGALELVHVARQDEARKLVQETLAAEAPQAYTRLRSYNLLEAGFPA